MPLTETQKRNLRKQVEGLYERIARLEAERDALRARLAEAEARVKGLEAAIHAECRRCTVVRPRLGPPEDCDWNTCPLWPHRAGANKEEAMQP